MAQDHTKYDRYGKNTLNVVDPDEDTTLNIHGDRDTHSLRVATYVWNPDTLEWEKNTGLGADNNLEDLLKGDYYHDAIIDYNSDSLITYAGIHPTMNASESDTNWLIYKIDYNSNKTTSRVRVRTGAWDSRTSGWS